MTDDPGGPARPDDVRPLRTEADAERNARVMPLLWLGLGAVVALVFALLLLGGGRFLHGKPAGPGPMRAMAAGEAPASLASGA